MERFVSFPMISPVAPTSTWADLIERIGKAHDSNNSKLMEGIVGGFENAFYFPSVHITEPATPYLEYLIAIIGCPPRSFGAKVISLLGTVATTFESKKDAVLELGLVQKMGAFLDFPCVQHMAFKFLMKYPECADELLNFCDLLNFVEIFKNQQTPENEFDGICDLFSVYVKLNHEPLINEIFGAAEVINTILVEGSSKCSSLAKLFEHFPPQYFNAMNDLGFLRNIVNRLYESSLVYLIEYLKLLGTIAQNDPYLINGPDLVESLHAILFRRTLQDTEHQNIFPLPDAVAICTFLALNSDINRILESEVIDDIIELVDQGDLNEKREICRFAAALVNQLSDPRVRSFLGTTQIQKLALDMLSMTDYRDQYIALKIIIAVLSNQEKMPDIQDGPIMTASKSNSISDDCGAILNDPNAPEELSELANALCEHI